MSHTPGPWHWDGSFPIRIIDAQDYVVCDGILPSGEANARLIAAAPELLTALKKCHEWLQGSKPGRAQYIGDVIAKAQE